MYVLASVPSDPTAIDDSAKGGLTQFWELLPWFLERQNILNVINIVIWKHLGLKLKIRVLWRYKALSYDWFLVQNIKRQQG